MQSIGPSIGQKCRRKTLFSYGKAISLLALYSIVYSALWRNSWIWPRTFDKLYPNYRLLWIAVHHRGFFHSEEFRRLCLLLFYVSSSCFFSLCRDASSCGWDGT